MNHSQTAVRHLSPTDNSQIAIRYPFPIVHSQTTVRHPSHTEHSDTRSDHDQTPVPYRPFSDRGQTPVSYRSIQLFGLEAKCTPAPPLMAPSPLPLHPTSPFPGLPKILLQATRNKAQEEAPPAVLEASKWKEQQSGCPGERGEKEKQGRARLTAAGVEVQPCDPPTPEVDAGGSEAQGHPWLHTDFQVRETLCHKENYQD